MRTYNKIRFDYGSPVEFGYQVTENGYEVAVWDLNCQPVKLDKAYGFQFIAIDVTPPECAV